MFSSAARVCHSIDQSTSSAPVLPEQPLAFSKELVLKDGTRMMREGLHENADALFTAALCRGQHCAEIWMAAGMARLQRGSLRAARSAFMMASWLGEDTVARRLADAIGAEQAVGYSEEKQLQPQ